MWDTVLSLCALRSSQRQRPDHSLRAGAESWLALGSAGLMAAATQVYLVPL